MMMKKKWLRKKVVILNIFCTLTRTTQTHIEEDIRTAASHSFEKDK